MSDNKIEATEALENLRKHYISYHSIDENNYYFKQLFLPSNSSKKSDRCNIEFKNCAVNKNNKFVYHYHQVRGRQVNEQLPMNIVKLGPTTQYRINFDQHEKYDFFDESIVNEFLASVYERFVPDGEQYKIMGYQHQPGEVELKSTRMWLTNFYTATHFNSYVIDVICKQILKRIILNGKTGSSWIFKRFNKLQIIFTSKKNNIDLFSS